MTDEAGQSLGAPLERRRDETSRVAEAGAPPICSRKGCRAAAAWELRWNNPKLHDPARRKTWLACDEHRQVLADFLSARGFLRETLPMT